MRFFSFITGLVCGWVGGAANLHYSEEDKLLRNRQVWRDGQTRTAELAGVISIADGGINMLRGYIHEKAGSRHEWLNKEFIGGYLADKHRGG